MINGGFNGHRDNHDGDFYGDHDTAELVRNSKTYPVFLRQNPQNWTN